MSLILLISSPILAAAISFAVRKKAFNFELATIIASIIELTAAINIAYVVAKKGSYNPTSYFSIDAMGALMIAIVAIIGFTAALYSISYLRAEVSKKVIGFHRAKQYYTLFNLFIAAMFFAISTVNPILMWIAIEATTLSTAFLISFYNKPSAMEAAWKYLMINSVGLLLGFFGTLLYFAPTINLHEGSGLINWQTLLSGASHFDPFMAKMAFVFVLIGYGTKIGLAPMHTWKPDAYSKAPTPIVAIFSGALLNVAFLALLRFKLITDTAIGSAFSSNLLVTLGVLSIVIAAFIIFIQKNYKRLLAYSSIEHAGIMALGFGFGGIGSFAALLHMIYHSLVKSALFFSVGNIFLKYSSTKIASVRGALSALPVTGAIFIIGFLAATGIPPFGIFTTEMYIFSAGIKSHPFISAIALLSVALIFVGFLRHTSNMLFGETPESTEKGESGSLSNLPSLILLIILIALGFFLPDTLKSLLNSATLNY